MKKILTTMFLATSITLCFAQWQQSPQTGGGPNHYPENSRQQGNYYQNSSLIINTVSQRPLSVSVDGQQYPGNSNTVNIGQLNSGNHRIVVYEEKRNFWGKQVKNIVYNSDVTLRSGYETTISINSFGQANISERQVNNNNVGGQNGYDNRMNNGKNGNNGKGHAYGKYKNKKNKNHDDDDGDDEDNDNHGRNKGNKNDRD